MQSFHRRYSFNHSTSPQTWKIHRQKCKKCCNNKNQRIFWYYSQSRLFCRGQALDVRVLKIKTAPNTFEYIITNLPFSFDINDIKTCYRLRWGIETSFRYLKHVNGLLYLHSKKPDFLKHEIYGNLILYNFGIFLANEAALEKQKQQLEIEQQHQSQNKYHYQVDFSSALRIARKYFWRDSRTEKDIIHLMIKYVHDVKEELRQFSRPLRGIGAVHFAFR